MSLPPFIAWAAKLAGEVPTMNKARALFNASFAGDSLFFIFWVRGFTGSSSTEPLKLNKVADLSKTSHRIRDFPEELQEPPQPNPTPS